MNSSQQLQGKENLPGGISSLEMSQDAQHTRRVADVGQMPHPSRRPSAESLRSNASQALYSNEYVKPDTPDAGSRLSGRRSESKGNGVPLNNPRNRQLDAPQEARSSLPPEKGFPIQIGPELFRLSGTSIMSDCESLCPRIVR